MSGKKTPKQKFVEYIRNLGLLAEEYEPYVALEMRVANHFKTEDTPEQLEPMLAGSADVDSQLYWTNPDWIAEEKLDGIRILMHFFKGKIRLTTRGKNPKTFLYNEKTDNYPQYQKCYRASLEGTILDGECLGGKEDNRPPIAAIQAINGALPEQAVATQQKYGWARFRVFDIIRFNGQSLYDWKWEDRRFILEKVCRKIGLVPTVVHANNKKELYEEIIKKGGEGVMLKHRESKYCPNSRESYWLKVKQYDDMECTITGWSQGGGKHKGKVGACTVSNSDGKVIGAFGNMNDALRNDMTDKRNGSLKKKYYGMRCVVRYQPSKGNLMRHCRLIRLIEEV